MGRKLAAGTASNAAGLSGEQPCDGAGRATTGAATTGAAATGAATTGAAAA